MQMFDQFWRLINKLVSFLNTGLDFELQDKIVIGSGLKSANLGLIGCMRNIKINGLLIEPRYLGFQHINTDLSFQFLINIELSTC